MSNGVKKIIVQLLNNQLKNKKVDLTLLPKGTSLTVNNGIVTEVYFPEEESFINSKLEPHVQVDISYTHKGYDGSTNGKVLISKTKVDEERNQAYEPIKEITVPDDFVVILGPDNPIQLNQGAGHVVAIPLDEIEDAVPIELCFVKEIDFLIQTEEE